MQLHSPAICIGSASLKLMQPATAPPQSSQSNNKPMQCMCCVGACLCSILFCFSVFDMQRLRNLERVMDVIRECGIARCCIRSRFCSSVGLPSCAGSWECLDELRTRICPDQEPDTWASGWQRGPVCLSSCPSTAVLSLNFSSRLRPVAAHDMFKHPAAPVGIKETIKLFQKW